MASTFTDYYKVLQVPKTATIEEIKHAFRKLARQHHPDLHPEKDKEMHTRRMQEINEAYTVLSSPENRAKYDQFGEHWKEGPPPPPPRAEGNAGGASQPAEEAFSEFFRHFQSGGGFGGTQAFDTSELDVEAELNLTLEEILRGVEKSFQLMTTGLCANCHGTGRVRKGLCPVCGGVGEIQQPRTIKTKIPPGLLDGGRIRLKGQGHPGASGAGDLYLTIRLLPDPHFKVDGKNLETQLRLMPWQAALGAEVSVRTLEDPVRVRIPKGTHTGKQLRLAGRGLGKAGARGDLFIRIEIDIPDTLSAQDEALFKQLAEEASHEKPA